MNHIFLPDKASKEDPCLAGRYGPNAMELLIRKIIGLGGHPQHLVAKVFGGASVLPTISEANAVGRKNIAFIIDFLQQKGIRIVGQDLGGLETRVIHFHADTGEAFLKRLPSIRNVYPTLPSRS